MMIQFEEVGTLNDMNNLTCSYQAALKKIKNSSKIVSYATFEDAASDVKQETLESFLVPVAYPDVGKFIMDSELKVVLTFEFKIPPLVLAGAQKIRLNYINNLYYHPATKHLIPELNLEIKSIQETASNAESAELAKIIENSSAITNQLCADFYMLNIHMVLRSGINMPFLVFNKQKHL